MATSSSRSNLKTTALILAASAACVGLAVFAVSRGTKSAAIEPGGPFITALADAQASIDRIEIARGGDTMALVRDGNAWTLASRDGYPARFEEVKALISGLASLRTDQKMTAKKERHDELALAWPDASGRGAKVRVLAGEKPVTEMVLGEERANPRSQYVRRADEDQCWRVLGSVVADLETRRWIEAELLSLPEGEVEGVAMNGLEIKGTAGADGKKTFAAGESAAPVVASDFEWTDLRKAAALRSLPGWLARLELEDVRKAKGGTVDPAISPSFDMVRGTLKVNAVRDGDSVWISFEAAPKPGAPSAEEINAKRKYPGDPFVPDWAEFAKKHAGWEYKLPAWKLASLEEALKTPTAEGDPNQPMRVPSARD
ncbi:MAG: hypothetical protein RLY21_72 [Planctomycetota bacterium]|jgi:hypothetical protein